MIDVKQAAKIASDYLTSFYSELNGLRLEEVEIDDTKQNWLITLSFIEDPALQIMNLPQIRTYKQFKISTESGEVTSMKIRELK